MANRLLQRNSSGIIYDPTIPTSGLTPAIRTGPCIVHSVSVSALTAAVWIIRDGTLVTDTPRLTIRVPIGQTNTVYFSGANFSNGIYAELNSGTGECSVEFSNI